MKFNYKRNIMPDPTVIVPRIVVPSHNYPRYTERVVSTRFVRNLSFLVSATPLPKVDKVVYIHRKIVPKGF